MVAFYPKIEIPALLIWGKQDWVIPLKYGERLAEEMPNAELHIVDKCRHTPQEECPAKTLDIISTFLSRI